MFAGRVNSGELSSPIPSGDRVTTLRLLKPPESASAFKNRSLSFIRFAESVAEDPGGSFIGSNATIDDLHASFSPI